MSTVTLRPRPLHTDRWVRDFLRPATVSEWRTPTPTSARPSAEIVKDGDDAVLRLDLPGIDVEKDVTVELDGGRLVVSGERRDEHADSGTDATLREIRYGAFKRSFAVPAQVTSDAVSASYDAGVLTVRVAGVHAGTQPQRITITT